MSKPPTFEIKRLRSAIAFFLFLSATTGYFCYEGYSYLQDQLTEERLVMEQIKDVQKREQADIERRRVNAEYSRSFSNLTDQGLFLESNKLDWVEKLELAARQLRIPLTKYELDTSSKMALPVGIPAEKLGLYKTPLHLSLTMLHEGDLLAIEDYLRNQNLGLFSFESCELRRTRDKPSFQRLEAMMSAECELNVYNFKFNDLSVGGMAMDAGMPAPEV